MKKVDIRELVPSLTVAGPSNEDCDRMRPILMVGDSIRKAMDVYKDSLSEDETEKKDSFRTYPAKIYHGTGEKYNGLIVIS